MNFLSLEYFLVIASEGSFSRAATQLFVSQQSLSEHVKKLEGELGVALFERGRGLSLTPAGELFRAGASEIMQIRGQMLSDIAHLAETKRTRITIAIATFDTPPFLPEVLHEYSAAYPQYEAVVVKRLSSDIVNNMRGVNLYFSFLPLEDELEHIELIERDQYVAVLTEEMARNACGDAWPALERRLIDTRDLALLNPLPFILLYNRNGELALDLRHIFRKYAFSPGVGFQSDNNDLNVAMCTRGAGVLLAPEDFMRRKLQMYSPAVRAAMRLYPVDTPDLKVTLAISHKKGRQLSPAEKAFVKVTRRVLNRADGLAAPQTL